jgi:hypothetical protein
MQEDAPQHPEDGRQPQEDVRQPIAGGESPGQPRAGDFFFMSEQDGDEYLGPEWTRSGGHEGLLSLLRGWGKMKANDMG